MDVNIVDTLIALVEERPTIWDKRSKSHSRRSAVEKCWKEIGSAILIDENTLRKKWKYLRDQFCVELGKVQTSPTGTSKWRHFQALEFLKETVIPRIYDKDDVRYYSENNGDDQSSSDYFENISEGKRKVKSEPKTKRKKIDEQNEQLSEADNNSVYEKTVFEDEHLHFFKSLLPHVRKIPEPQVLSFRGRIQRLVEESAYASDQPSAAFVPEFPIKVSPQRYSPEACDPIDTSD